MVIKNKLAWSSIEDMYELFVQNEETFVNIRNCCKNDM